MVERAPRLRLATDVDLSKAKPSCKRCNGTGRRGLRTIEDPENKGKEVKIPVICRCVTRRGGIKEDQLDGLLKKMKKEMDSGDFPAHMAKDIMSLPMEPRLKAISMLEADVKNKDKPKKTREVTAHALKLIKQEMKETSYGDA